MPTQSPSSPSRREFFKRAGTVTAAVAVAVAPLSLFAQKPKVWKDEDGKVVIDGDNVTVYSVLAQNGVEIHAAGDVQMMYCTVHSNGAGVVIESKAKPETRNVWTVD